MKHFFIILSISVIVLSSCTNISNISGEKSSDENIHNSLPEGSENSVDENLFSKYEAQASDILNRLTLEEKAGQIFLSRYPDKENLDLYISLNPGGFILFGKDFENKTKEEIISDINYFQSKSTIPMIVGVDEEGGTVVRVSSNPLLSDERFRSPQELYSAGGYPAIKKNSYDKTKLLLSLGINLNLAPVADVSIDKNDFIYKRAFGKSATQTAIYVKTVVKAMVDNGISCTLKHFPGYGSNSDTHTDIVYDDRSIDIFKNSDFLPFSAGIKAGAQSILVSHNIVQSIDSDLPASLSKNVIKILKEDLKFSGIIMTDDLSMGAIKNFKFDQSPEIIALNAGNDMLIVSNLEESFKIVLEALKTGELSESKLDKAVLKILEWKISMGLM